MKNFNNIYFLLLIIILFSSCVEQKLSSEPKADFSVSDEIRICEPIEKVKTVEDVKGIILYDEWLEDYVIKRGIDGTFDSVDIGFICDLPKEYQKQGIKVIFSGVYYNIEDEKKKLIPIRMIGEMYYILEVTGIKLIESSN